MTSSQFLRISCPLSFPAVALEPTTHSAGKYPCLGGDGKTMVMFDVLALLVTMLLGVFGGLHLALLLVRGREKREAWGGGNSPGTN
jgi:hypothetical protein